MKKLHLPNKILYVDTIVSIAKFNQLDIQIEYTYVYNYNGSVLFGNMNKCTVSFRNTTERNSYFITLEKLVDGINNIKPNLTVVEPLKPKKK